ncbi:hypothetical protein [Nonomuraea sp. SBT364]|uniref:hypothetical protein n=1 Tax=Nonomuraea sp. SBT364 TaxID=1580530 RepID=UPI00066ADA35|nr:hypothetical protein [Nonomuraea sp. SBT364]
MSVHGEKAEEILCPSARCEKDAILLGVLDATGRLGYIRPALRIDDDFVAGASGGRTPEERFRFAQPCVEGGCRNWTGERCAVIDDALESGAGTDSLPACSIRRTCRWFAQAGLSACAVCPLIVRNVRTADPSTA